MHAPPAPASRQHDRCGRDDGSPDGGDLPGRPPDPEGYTFLGGVELTDDGTILATDKGASPTEGTLSVGTLPSLSPTGAVGTVDEDQVFVPWDDTLLVSNLFAAFEGLL